MSHYIGLDLGGTNIKAGLVSDTGKPISKISVPTQAEGGVDAVVENLIQAATAVMDEAGLQLSEVQGIGIGAPGLVDTDAGIVIAAPNLPGFRDIPLATRIQNRTGVQTWIENDANAAAMGEFWVGSGRDGQVRDLVMLTLGTGVGSGIIIQGRVFHGGFGIAGELGHMIVKPGGTKCSCGQRGCLEMYASASGTGRRAAEAVAAGEASSLSQHRTITSKEVFDAAKQGDALAMRIVRETAEVLGIAVVNLCRILDPHMIVFAGGMILAGDMLFDQIRSVVRENWWNMNEPRVRIVPAELGNDAGFIGAAAVAWDQHQQAEAS